jgi:acetyl-CoA decarbonylase/synthase complex subunit gamma
MALTGLQIQKLLPKTNCKECGSNTCLAFAMKLAARKTEISQCPYASDEAKQTLGAAYEPPVRCLEFGADKSLKSGAETVLYRHEKTFVHPTLLAININDTDPAESVETALQQIRDYVLERVGEKIKIDMVAVTQKGAQAEAFVQLAQKARQLTGKPLILRSDHPATLQQAARALKGTCSVLATATPSTVAELVTVARENDHVLAVTAPDLNALVQLTTHLKSQGFNDFLLHFQTHSRAEQFQTNTIARRAALKDNYKPLGNPALHFIETTDVFDATVAALNEINKYGGICVLPEFNAAQLATLMTLRLNIYTDPQKPIQVEPKIYAIGEPVATSPVFVTTNFSLTYFMVSAEIENCGISAWLVVPECEGLSVLTAWAAGKFSGALIAKAMKEFEVEAKIKTREVIIPGYVAQISGELEESLPGWKVLVGPQEAADLESFIKARLN